MRRRCWIIIGEHKVRKSSVARSLLGVDDPRSYAEAETVSGLRFRIHPCISAYQERNKTPDDMIDELDEKPNDEAKEQLDDHHFRNALVVLRYDRLKNYPHGKEYVERLLKEGWEIEAIISLNIPCPAWVRDSGIPNLDILNVADLTSRDIARQVRQAIGWK